MKLRKNYVFKVVLLLALIVGCMTVMVACDEPGKNECNCNCSYCKSCTHKSEPVFDTKDPYKYEKPFGIELTVATVSARNAGRDNYAEIRNSNLLTENSKVKFGEVQEKTGSDVYGIYLGYDADDNVVLYIGGVIRGAQYEKYDCALTYSPRDVITKMEEAVGHELTEDWLNARATGIDIIFIPKGGKYEVAYTAEIDGQVYIVTM